ncbi:MAG: hypothetical protein J6A37_06025 [Oscillospiraceae bacterium]|nr:hypothetical protein [Oscillospiraceae bacterium]
MGHISDTEELMRVLCGAADTAAYGVGRVSLNIRSGEGFVRLYKGGIARVKAVISASGGSRGEVIAMTDEITGKLTAFSGEGVIKISAPFPAVLEKADKNGDVRFCREIEVIYRYTGGENQ